MLRRTLEVQVQPGRAVNLCRDINGDLELKKVDFDKIKRKGNAQPTTCCSAGSGDLTTEELEEREEYHLRMKRRIRDWESNRFKELKIVVTVCIATNK